MNTRDMTLKVGRELSVFGGHGIDRKLPVMRTTPAVFWSERGNSYVVVYKEGNYRIISINGIGEIRWTVEEWNRDAESVAAIQYFLE